MDIYTFVAPLVVHPEIHVCAVPTLSDSPCVQNFFRRAGIEDQVAIPAAADHIGVFAVYIRTIAERNISGNFGNFGQKFLKLLDK